LIWDDAGTTQVAYYSPESIGERHHLPAETTAALGAINTLTDLILTPAAT
jgi:hypothetical protein